MPVEDGDWPPEPATTAPAALVTGTDHFGPSSVSSPATSDLEPHRVGDEDANPQQEQEETQPLPTLDPKFREDFDGLLFLGKLEDEFTWLGHRFVIRTLTTEEILETGLIVKPYRDTMAEVKAYQAAIVAGTVVSVDGRPMPTPLTMSPSDTPLRNRFEYVRRNWFPPTLDVVYERYLLLEDRARAALEAMGEASR